MKKKLVSIVLSLAMIASVISGCGSNDDNSGAGTESGNTQTADGGSGNTQTADGGSAITGTITVLTNRTDLIDNKFAEYAETFEANVNIVRGAERPLHFDYILPVVFLLFL